MFFKFIVLIACLTSPILCLSIDPINSQDTVSIDNELKGSVSVDQALNSANKVVKVEETTTSGQLFNNNDALDEEKFFKINDDDLIESSNLSKQSQGGMPNVQSLIDQTNTISQNLENMIKDMTQNKRHATATMLRLMLQNVRRLNTSLVRLNNRVSSLSIGSSPGSAASSGSSSSSSVSNSVSSSVSNATYNAAAQINSVVMNIRNQLNSVSTEINNLLQRIKLSMPGTPSKPASTPASG